jgi:glycosyltransferase involved in cell wall biosynthesis
MVGRLVDQKDPLAFARMALSVAARLPHARFLVVGDGPLRGALEETAAPLVADRRLQVTGFRDDVPELLATMDVVVFPSLWEAQGLALIEAMAAERAVVASRLPAHREAVEDGESGILVTPGDADAMGDAVASLLADPALRRRLGTQARLGVERRYRIETMIEATAEIYRAARTAGRAVFHAA